MAEPSPNTGHFVTLKVFQFLKGSNLLFPTPPTPEPSQRSFPLPGTTE